MKVFVITRSQQDPMSCGGWPTFSEVINLNSPSIFETKQKAKSYLKSRGWEDVYTIIKMKVH